MFSNRIHILCVQSVVGISIPIETKDKVNWRTMNLGVNFQAQFIPIPTIIYPWTRFERSMIHQKKQFQEHGTYVADESRQFVYSVFEVLMDRLRISIGLFQKAQQLLIFRRGKNGRQCLLRAICEASQTPITHVGVFDEVLQLFLTLVSLTVFLCYSLQAVINNPSFLYRPNENEIHTEYIDAKVAGRYGVDCLSLYHKCPHGHGLLDSISFFKT